MSPDDHRRFTRLDAHRAWCGSLLLGVQGEGGGLDAELFRQVYMLAGQGR